MPGVTFLGTVGEILEEGQRMGHCIATRAEDALHGRCYLFHIDHQGERASVQVSAAGNVVEAQGPHNTENAAVWWGVIQLRTWGASLCLREMVPTIAPIRRPGRARRADPRQLALPF